MATNGSTNLGVRTLTTAGLVAVVAALVLGILGMHGLNQHGTTAHASTAVAAVAVDPHAAHPAPDHKPVATGTDAATAAVGVEAAATPGDHDSISDMMMLCAAMLLAAAAGLLLTLRLVRYAHLAPASLLPRVRISTFPATARAGTGPPPVWEFSVVRC